MLRCAIRQVEGSCLSTERLGEGMMRLTINYADVWQSLAGELGAVFREVGTHRNALEVRTKRDGSVWSEADRYVQREIVRLISRFDPRPCVVAEEGMNTAFTREATCPRVWVIDPIDGTREFLNGGVEFCCAIAAIESGMPVACFIFLPELGHEREGVLITVDGAGADPLINGARATTASFDGDGMQTQVSATRRDRSPRAFEGRLALCGAVAKTQATSLTLDMVRTCLDISAVASLGSFDWFYREHQRIWDAAAGISVAAGTGRVAMTLCGEPLVPLPAGFLEQKVPTLSTTVIASAGDIGCVMSLLASR
ncbi:MAG: hypothetical protein E7812_17660 [Phenylobacterium sp.]|nr:MAG: hypothetical protein E7812_17660 [Phenylobacterium sp.]